MSQPYVASPAFHLRPAGDARLHRQPVGEHLTRMHKIVMGLEIQPEFRRVSSPNIS